MIIDLSVRLNNETPAYPGDAKIEIKESNVLALQGYQDHSVFMGTHTGTHIDAPGHMIEGGKTLDEFSAEQFVGRGVYIAVNDNNFELNDIKKSDIQAGDIVVFNTGMSNRIHDEVYFTDYPAMGIDVAEYLVERRVRMVGVDTCSIDNQPGFPVHKLLLSNNILIIENLTNLEQLSGMDSKIYALPLKLNLDGAPARVIAEVL